MMTKDKDRLGAEIAVTKNGYVVFPYQNCASSEWYVFESFRSMTEFLSEYLVYHDPEIEQGK